MNIAILEDDSLLANSLKKLVENERHRATVFYDGESLLTEIRRQTFDLFLLDWTLPDMSGFDMLGYLRNDLQLVTPIVFLSAYSDEKFVATALNAGADDYIIKPYRKDEFVARIRTIDRRRSLTTGVHLESNPLGTICGYTFNHQAQTISFNDEVVVLKNKEFRLAELLFHDINRPVTRQKLILALWGSVTVDRSRSLDVYINKLRKILRLNGGDSHLRLTAIYNFGYRLVELS